MISSRLRRSFQRWKRLTANRTVLNLINTGLKLNLQQTQPSGRRPPPTDKIEVKETLQDFLRRGIIELAPRSRGQRHPFFSIPKNSGGLRWILNLMQLNRFVPKRTFRMETLNFIREMMQPGDFVCSIDLLDAFYHILIWKRDRRFLRFQALGRTYQFKALPMGLTTSPWALAKVVGEAVKRLREQGVRISYYADDLFIMGRGEKECREAAEKTLQLLHELGFLINEEKSHLTPVQDLVHLGFRLNTRKNRLTVPGQKLQDLRVLARRCLNRTPTARQMAALLGKLNHCALAMPMLKFRKRPLERDLADCLKRWGPRRRGTWDRVVSLNPASITLLRALTSVRYLRSINGVRLMPDPNVNFRLTTDASPDGWGATLVTPTIQVQTQGRWSKSEKKQTSNWKELSAIKLAVMSFRHLIPRGASLLIESDNSTALAYLRGTGRLPRLLQAAEPVINWFFKKKITWLARHIPGILNSQADTLSRHFSRDHDWQLSKNAFKAIVDRWGPMRTDLFASRLNKKCPQYISRYCDPQAKWRDAWCHHWYLIDGPAYICPPWPLLSRVVQRLAQYAKEKQQLTCHLVCPLWQGARWWPTLKQLAQDWMLLPRRSLVVGPSGFHPAHRQPIPQLVAVRIRCNEQSRNTSAPSMREAKLVESPVTGHSC
jgi:hypothetical protein